MLCIVVQHRVCLLSGHVKDEECDRRGGSEEEGRGMRNERMKNKGRNMEGERRKDTKFFIFHCACVDLIILFGLVASLALAALSLPIL